MKNVLLFFYSELFKNNTPREEYSVLENSYPAGIYLLKVKNRNNRAKVWNVQS